MQVYCPVLCLRYVDKFYNLIHIFLSPLCWLLIVSIVGDSLNSSLVAVVSVDHDVLKAWAASEGNKVAFAFY